MPDPRLPHSFIDLPIAHRALHDREQGRIENAPASIRAAIDAGFAIEIDIQASSDGVAMVFHDYDLERLTGLKGDVRQQTAAQLQTLELSGSSDTIPTLQQVLGMVGGSVPLLIEIKDQDGAMGGNTGALERAVCADLEGYAGDVALMSFNPHAVAACKAAAPHIPRGLTTAAYGEDHWPYLSEETRTRLARIADFEQVGASFISHDRRDLTSDSVARLKSAGTPVLTWTIRNPEQEAEARKVADGITFEGYLPRHG